MRGACRCGADLIVETVPSPRSEHVTTSLLRRQLEAIDAWNVARAELPALLPVSRISREDRLDAARRHEAQDRAHAALIARLDALLAADAQPLLTDPAPRAVLVHRQEWFVRAVASALEDLGVRVLTTLSNGADAVGVLVAEQPELLLVEESLPMMSGRQVVAQAQRFAPATVLVAQVSCTADLGTFLDGGVRAAVARQVPPADVAQQMSALLPGSA